MEDRIKLLVNELGQLRVKRDADISEHISSGFGGTVAAFYIATTTKELIKAVEICKELKLNFLVIGSGSKVAISDSGVKGMVIKNRSSSIKIQAVKGKVSKDGLGLEEAFLEVDSGVSVVRICEFAKQNRLLGLNQLQTMAGTVGGNLYINPTLRSLTYQVKVLNGLGFLKSKQIGQLLKDDVIISIIFKLKAEKV